MFRVELISLERYGWLFDNAIPDIAYLSFTQNIFMGFRDTFGGHFLGVTWSLAVEEQFYLVLPLSLLAIGPMRFKHLIVLCIAAAPFLRLAFPGFGSIVNMPFRMDSLLLGVLLAVIFRSDKAVVFLKTHRATLWGIFAVLLLGMGVMTLRGVGRSFLEPTAIAFFYAVFIALTLIHRDQSVTAIMRSRILTRFGLYSYGIYMYHQMIAGLMHGYFRHESPSMETITGIGITTASLLATVTLAVVSHHTLEAYFLSLGKRFSYNDRITKR